MIYKIILTGSWDYFRSLFFCQYWITVTSWGKEMYSQIIFCGNVKVYSIMHLWPISGSSNFEVFSAAQSHHLPWVSPVSLFSQPLNRSGKFEFFSGVFLAVYNVAGLVNTWIIYSLSWRQVWKSWRQFSKSWLKSDKLKWKILPNRHLLWIC